MLSTEPQKITFYSSSRKNEKLCKNFRSLAFFFGHQRQKTEKIPEKVSGAFSQAVLVTSSYTEVDIKTAFRGRG